MKKGLQDRILLRRFEKSGLSISRFCLREGISQAGFRRLLASSSWKPKSGSGSGFFQAISFVDSGQVWIPVVEMNGY